MFFKKRNDFLDGTRRQSTNQEESGTVGYIQNAEQQNANTIWKRLKGIK
jgi:hypothetical protein